MGLDPNPGPEPGPRKSNPILTLAEHEKKQKLEMDAMFRLEHGEVDRSTLKKALPTLSHIQEAQSAWKDDFALNSMLRKRFRVSGVPGPGSGPQAVRHQQQWSKENESHSVMSYSLRPHGL